MKKVSVMLAKTDQVKSINSEVKSEIKKSLNDLKEIQKLIQSMSKTKDLDYLKSTYKETNSTINRLRYGLSHLDNLNGKMYFATKKLYE